MLPLSHKRVQLIEDHWKQVTNAAIQQIRQDAEMPLTREIPDSELDHWYGPILGALRAWRAMQKDGELAYRFEALGDRRFVERVPLHETVRSLQILKHKMIEFVRNQGLDQSSLEIYKQEEFEHRIGLLFDCLIYYVVRGYETAVRNAAPSVFESPPSEAQINWNPPDI